MKVVIDIPEDVLKRTVFYREFRDLNDCVTTIKALEKAVPLPKGHGRLIDAGALDKEVISHVHSGYAESPKDCAKFSMMIITAPTIIEAEE